MEQAQKSGAQRRAKQLMQSATKGHGAFMTQVGQVWAFPSLLAFSVGAFIKLGGDGLIPSGIATASRIGATIILLISGVLALHIAFYSIGSAIGRRRVTWRIAWDIFLIVVVAPLETWTLYLLFTGQPINGPVDLMRAAEAVVATVYLATLVIQPPSDREFVRLIGSRAGELTATKLELIPLDEVGMGRLYQVQAVANDESLTWSQRADKLVGVMEELAPGEQERAHQEQIAALEHERDAARADAQRQIEGAQERVRQLTDTAQRQITEANAASERQSVQRASDALLSLLTTGALPDWLTELRPDLAGVTLDSLIERMGGASGKRGRGAASVSPADTSRAGRQRAFLLEQGIEPSAAPQGKRGVWLRAADVTVLTGGKPGTEKPQDLVRRLGNGATVGRNLVAPFEPVLRELSERHLLNDAARIWWAAQTHETSGGGDDDREEDSGELPAVITQMRRA